MNFFNKYILSGVLFGIFSALSSRNIAYGILGGILFGLFYGLVISIFEKKQAKNFEKIKGEISKEKTIIFDGAANHFAGKEAVGGWLYLTDKELIFKSHNYNIQNHEIIIPVAEIQKAEKYLTLGVIPNGLRITSSGKEDKFVVNNRENWMQLLQQFEDNINI